jgi:8-oxo-dGTP pyrophosphatase MutT (NUDIX family)
MDLHRVNVASLERALRATGAASSDFDLDPEFRPPSSGRRLKAASVLVPLIERGAGLDLILTRRAALLKHHPGQVAFPGGRQDPDDASPLAAALREAREEIGLESVEILGELPAHETVTGYSVTPFVGLVARGFRPIIDRREVAEVFEVPLAFVLDASSFQVHGRRWQGQERRYYTVPYGPHYIWGATARMLRTLADRMREP